MDHGLVNLGGHKINKYVLSTAWKRFLAMIELCQTQIKDNLELAHQSYVGKHMAAR